MRSLAEIPASRLDPSLSRPPFLLPNLPIVLCTYLGRSAIPFTRLQLHRSAPHQCTSTRLYSRNVTFFFFFFLTQTTRPHSTLRRRVCASLAQPRPYASRSVCCALLLRNYYSGPHMLASSTGLILDVYHGHGLDNGSDPLLEFPQSWTMGAVTLVGTGPGPRRQPAHGIPGGSSYNRQSKHQGCQSISTLSV